jgi:hypothetical protein
MVAPTSTALTDGLTRITNANPAPGTTLQAGQTVTFNGTVGYTLASVVGTVDMTVRDQNDRYLPLNANSPVDVVVVTRGTGDVTFSGSVSLPDSGVTSVRIVFTLSPNGVPPSTTLDVSYPVR